MDAQLKLYSLLVDQIQKYNAIVWQWPTALLAANLIPLLQSGSQVDRPLVWLFASFVNGGMIYAFYRTLERQSEIITAAQRAETYLRNHGFSGLVPEFQPPENHLPGGQAILGGLVLADGALFVFALIGICGINE